jgi:hypothetical protein
MNTENTEIEAVIFGEVHLTVNHSQSSQGVPVLVLDREAYGPCDFLFIGSRPPVLASRFVLEELLEVEEPFSEEEGRFIDSWFSLRPGLLLQPCSIMWPIETTLKQVRQWKGWQDPGQEGKENYIGEDTELKVYPDGSVYTDNGDEICPASDDLVEAQEFGLFLIGLSASQVF